MRVTGLFLLLVAAFGAGCGGAPVPAGAPTLAAASGSASSAPTIAPSATPTVAPSASPSATPTFSLAPRDTMEFGDVASGVALVFEIGPFASNKGLIAIRVPDRGAYVIEAGSALVMTPTSIDVSYEGPAVLSPLTSLADETPRGIVKEPTDVRVKLHAQLDPVTRTGTAVLEHDGVLIPMDARVPDVVDLPAVLDAFERAWLAADWRLLYTVMNTDVTRTNTVDAFEKELADQNARIGSVTSIRRGAVSGPEADAFGWWVVTVEYEIETRSPNGATSAARYDAFFMRQPVGWRLLFTSER